MPTDQDLCQPSRAETTTVDAMKVLQEDQIERFKPDHKSSSPSASCAVVCFMDMHLNIICTRNEFVVVKK